MADKVFLPQVATNSTQIVSQLKSGQLLALAPERLGGLIICKRHHAEFAGAGSAVGGLFDLTCVRVIPLGDAVLVHPESREARQQAYATRQKWIDLTQKAIQHAVPLWRAQAILTLFEQYFDAETAARVPDDVVALLAAVLPKTVEMARQSAQVSGESSVKNRRISPAVTAGSSSCGVSPTSSSC